MKRISCFFWLSLSCLGYSETRYVVKDNPNAALPYTAWSNAAATIQAAVDASASNDTIWVTNGVYETGGRTANGALTNRVAIDKPVVVRSVKGPEFTFITGAGSNGNAAIRCVYLGTNAALIGFTLTNGHTRLSSGIDGAGGGIFCEPSSIFSNCILTGNSATRGGGANGGTLYNCMLIGNSARLFGGGAHSGTLYHCTLSGNSATSLDGGGTYGGTLYNCTLTCNSAYRGGGAAGSTLYHCALTDNSAFLGGGVDGSMIDHCTLSGNSAFFGGGVYGDKWNNCTLSNCLLSGNSAYYGGGVAGGTLYHCTLTDNSAFFSGGGAFGDAMMDCACTLNSCALSGNLAGNGGGAVYAGTLYNCTLTGNRAGFLGGGTQESDLYNCIIYYNTANRGPNSYNDTLNYCCATPDPGGVGNITNEPLLTSSSHLGAGSPCIGKGNTTYASGTDIDGDAWFTSPSMGCDEYYAGTRTGHLAVAIAASFTNVSVGFPIAFTALIDGRATANGWSFGDGMEARNHPCPSHAWSNPGIFPVVLTAWNDRNPQGVSTTVLVTVAPQPVHYVKEGNLTPSSPFLTWHQAAATIQDAVDAATTPGAVVLVTNGIYEVGGRTANGSLTNRVVIDKPILVRSVNGPKVTIIEGAGPLGNAAIRCVYLGTNAALSGFMLTNGHTIVSSGFDCGGGGIFCEPFAVLSNCVLAGNSAYDGGGVFFGTLFNCTLTGNSASNGGGVSHGVLYNSTLTDNLAGSSGGGVDWCTLYNCIVYHNIAAVGSNFSSGTLNYCCATPDPGGTGNITNDPLFVDYADGNLHLQSNSPCINTGINQDWMAGSTDLDGNPRIRRGQVDMGAYESDHWGQFSDLDADGFSDWIEVYRTGTDPTNAASYLGMGIPIESDGANTGLVVRWPSAAEKTYRLARTTNLMEDFISFSNRLNATPPMNTYTDETAIGWGPWYYRVGVE